jgi:hypothetical protein
MLSVVMPWMNYSALTDKLAKAAEDEGDIEAAWTWRRLGWRIVMRHTKLGVCVLTRSLWT